MALKQINTFENLTLGHLKYKDHNNRWQQLVVTMQWLRALSGMQFGF